MKKSVISLLMIFTMLTAIACEKQIKRDDASLNKNTLQGKVEVWTSDSSKDVIESYVRKFKEENVSVEINNISINKNEIDKKISEVISSGKGIPDIMILSEEEAQQVKKFKDELLDLSSDANLLGGKSIRGRDGQINVDNKVIAVPLNVVPAAMFYREDLFREANIEVKDIKTWNDYIEAGKKIFNHTNGSIKLLPLNSTKDISLFKQMLNQLGAGYYDDGGKVLLNSQAALRSMTIIKSMNDSKIVYDVSNDEDIIAAAKDNKIASIISGVDIIPMMRERLQDQSGKWGIMNMPAFEPGGVIASIKGYTYISMGKNAGENKAAIELKNFLFNNKELGEFSIVNKGVFPMISQSYNEAFMDNKDEYFNNEKIWRYLTEIVKEAPEFKVIEENSKIRDELIAAQKNILIKNKDIKAVLQDIDIRMNKSPN